MSAGLVVATWPEVQAAITAAQGAITVYIDSSITSPAPVPTATGTTECFGSAVFAAYNQSFNTGTFATADILLIKDKAILHRPKAFLGNLTVQCECVTSNAMTFNVSPNPIIDNLTLEGVNQSFAMNLVSLAGATKPIIQMAGDLMLTTQNVVLSNQPAASIIDFGASGQFFWFARQGLRVTANSFSAPGGSTTSIDFAHDLGCTYPGIAASTTNVISVLVTETPSSVVYRPGSNGLGAAGSTAFWLDVQAYIAAAAGALTVYVDDTFAVGGAPVPTGSGVTDCQGATTIAAYENKSTPTVLIIQDGAQLKRPKAFVGNLTVECVSQTVPSFSFNVAAAPFDTLVLDGSDGTLKLALQPGALLAPISIPNGGELIINTRATSIVGQPGAVPIFQIGSGVTPSGVLGIFAVETLTFQQLNEIAGGIGTAIGLEHDLTVVRPTLSPTAFAGAWQEILLEAASHVIYRPGATSSPTGPVLATWNEVQAWINGADGALTVFIDSSITSPAPVDSGVTSCNGATVFASYSDDTFGATADTLIINDGAQISRPKKFQGNLIVQCDCGASGTPSLNFNTGAAPFDQLALEGSNGILNIGQTTIAITATATIAPIQVVAGGVLLLVTRTAQLDGSANPAVPIISLLGAGSALAWTVYDTLNLVQLTEIAGVANSTIDIQHGLSSTLPTLNPAVFLGGVEEFLAEPVSAVIYRPGFTSNGQANEAVPTWAEVVARINSAVGQGSVITVYVDSSITSPAIVPASSGTTSCRGAVTLSPFNTTSVGETLHIQDGAVLDRLRGIVGELTVEVEAVTTSPLTFAGAAPFDNFLIDGDDSAATLSVLAGALVPVAVVPAGVELALTTRGVVFESAVPAVGIFGLAGAGSFLAWITDTGGAVTAPPNLVTGGAGTLFAFIHDLASTLPTLSSFTGTTTEVFNEPVDSVIYRPGFASNGAPNNAVPTWAEVQVRISGANGAITVYIDDSIVSPAVVSAGTTECKGAVTIAGYSGHITPRNKLRIPSNATLHRVKAFEGLQVNLQASGGIGAALTFQTAAAPFDTLELRDAAAMVIEAGATTAPIAFSGSFAVICHENVTIDNSASPTIPFVFANAAGDVLIWQVFDGFTPTFTSLTPPTVSFIESVAGSTVEFITDDTFNVPSVFTGVAGSLVALRASVVSTLANGWNDNPANVVPAALVNTLITSVTVTPQVSGKFRVRVTGQIDSAGAASVATVFLAKNGVLGTITYPIGQFVLPAAGNPGQFQSFACDIATNLAAPGGGSSLPETYPVGTAVTFDVVIIVTVVGPQVIAHHTQIEAQEGF